MEISDKAIDLIMRFETGGRDYYEKFLSRPNWPGTSSSGVTIGAGIDLAYDKDLLDGCLRDYLTSEQIKRLKTVVGIKGQAAKAAATKLKDIYISYEDARTILVNCVLPKYIKQTLSIYPNAIYTNPDTFGALVSLVFNRGTDLSNTDRRKEMRNIATILKYGNDTLVDNEDLEEIAKQIESMKRLWPKNPNSNNGLYDRRIAEAKLVRESIT